MFKGFRPSIEQIGENGSRKKTNNKWFKTQDTISYWKNFNKEKIVYSEIVQSPQFYLDKNNYFPDVTSYL